MIHLAKLARIGGIWSCEAKEAANGNGVSGEPLGARGAGSPVARGKTDVSGGAGQS